MFFSKPSPLINSFTLSVSSSRIDKTVAYGPGSCINGSLSLNNSQLLDVYELSVLFQCQIKQNNTTSTFFKVKEIILNKRKEYHGCKVEAGNHLYLFAIQLPINNYPPTILNETFAGEYEITYTLQGYLEHSSTHTIIQTNSHPIIYLPLINVIQDKTFNAQSQQVYTRTSSSSLSSPTSSSIELTAKLLQPSFCPGELCSLQINTKNTTDSKIEQFYITIITHLQTDHTIKQHMLYHQPFPVAIPKQTTDHATTLSFLLPYISLPTCHYNENDVCIIIKHEMIIGLSPNHHQQRLLMQQDQNQQQQQQPTSPTSLKRFSTSSWLQSFYPSNNNNSNNTNPPSPSATTAALSPPLLSFPILITTVPIQSLLNQAKRPSIPVIFEESPSSTDLTSTETILCKSTPLPKFIPTSTSPLLRSHLITDTDTEEEDDDVLSVDLNNQYDKYSVSPSSSFQLDCMSKNNSIIHNNNQDSILSFSDNHKNVSTHLMVPTKSHSGISNVVE
ncbi:hypothetical protein BJ944DRAFT_288977 [Cunninghamella echinulata]|nr:hypothetical protein BJ944DRAFT_288977 [Cunninghamella echinulata]